MIVYIFSFNVIIALNIIKKLTLIFLFYSSIAHKMVKLVIFFIVFPT